MSENVSKISSGVDVRVHSGILSALGSVYSDLITDPSSLIFMPILQQAKKAMRSSARKRVFNVRRTRAMKDVVKEIRDLVTEGKAKDAKAKLAAAYKAIDKAAKRGVIKKNTAARKKSRLSALLKKSAN